MTREKFLAGTIKMKSVTPKYVGGGQIQSVFEGRELIFTRFGAGSCKVSFLILKLF